MNRGTGAAWRWLAVAILVASALTALGFLLFSGPSREVLGPVRGLRLGMAPSHARDRLRTDARGSFRGEATGEDFALLWEPASPSSELRSARLEFHTAQLVALRLTLSPSAPEADGPPLEVSEASILTRERTPDGVLFTWIARSCPTHRDEVRRRMNRRPPSAPTP